MVQRVATWLWAEEPKIEAVGGLTLMAWAGERGHYWVATAGGVLVVGAMFEQYVVRRRRG